MPVSTWRLPEQPLRADALLTLGLGLAAVGAASVALGAVLPVGPWYAVKASGGLAAGLAVVLAGLGAHHPHTRFGPANHVTLGRASLTALLAGLVGEPEVTATAATVVLLASVATALDNLDGWLARRYDTASAFGARFDMEVDALLVLVLSVLAWQWEKAGAWVLLSGLLRYMFVVAAAVLPWMGAPLPSRRRRQTVCVIQLIGLITVLAPFIRPPLSAVLAAIALAILVWSFIVDVRWLVAHREAA